MVSPKKDKNALTYKIRWGVWFGGNVATWTIVDAASSRPPTAINGLTPGTVYAFQVSTFNSTGHSDWSDVVTRMVI